jgi:hypothetical protein
MRVWSHGRTLQKLYWVGGSKGGVGKSLVAVAVIDYLMERNEPVLLVECDTSTADVWKMYRNVVPSERLDLDVADGWIDLVNACSEHSDRTVVVNTGARNGEAVGKCAGVLGRSLEELGRELVAFWVINRLPESFEPLAPFVRVVPMAHVHVVRNGYFGEERQFDRFNESRIRRELVEGRGGKCVTLPELADEVADDLYIKRLSLAEAARTLPIGSRAELGRWRELAQRMLSEVLGS